MKKKSTLRNKKRYHEDKIYRERSLNISKEWRKENPKRNKELQKEWYNKNRSKVLAQASERYKANKDVILQRGKQYRRKNWIQHTLRDCRKRANAKGWEFDLKPEDIVVPSTCIYLQIPIHIPYLGKPRAFDAASIDRIDSSKGYVKGNIQIISRKANTMKSDATKEELLVFARSILSLYK